MDSGEKYCIRCGRRLGKNEPLIDGYCIDCYLKYRGIFSSKPAIKVTICPRCGSWYYRGEWRESLPLRQVIRRVFLREAFRFVDKPHVEIVDIDIVSDPYKINEAQYAVKTRIHAVVENAYPVNVEEEIILNVEKKICPRCIAQAGKIHRALVQIRSVSSSFTDKEKKLINKALSDPGVAAEIVEIEENKHGIDVKLLTSIAAKRLSTILHRATGAKVIESFKPTRYSPDKGRWTGITTLSVRLPSLYKGDLVEYRGRPGVVRETKSKGVEVEFLDNGEKQNISYEEYWSGDLKHSDKLVYGETYSVVAVDKTTIYLLNEKTGELSDYPKTRALSDISEGEKLRAVRVRDKVYIIRYNDLGDNDA